MPTNRTKRARNRAGAMDHWKLDDLITGDCLLAGVGYAPANSGGGCNQWTDDERASVRQAMRADWELHGSAVMSWWRGENERFTRYPGSTEDQREKLRSCIGARGETQPWAAREFGGND